MSEEAITAENVGSHIKTLYGYVKVLADNHNQIVDHLKAMRDNVNQLHKHVSDLKGIVQSGKSSK